MAQVPINKKALEWAIRSSDIPADRVDEYFKFPPGTVNNWIVGSDKPNQTQFNSLKAKLKRPAAIFFMADPPPTAESRVEFRVAIGETDRTMPPKARHFIRDSIRVQSFIKEIMQELGYKLKDFPDNSTNEHPEDVAQHIRDTYFDVSIDKQMSWSTETNAFRQWRSLVEQLGILVFLYPIGKNPDTKDKEVDFKNSVRGFSNATEHPPVIGISSSWSSSVRIYTLFHELGHILTRTSSACAEVYDKALKHEAKDQIERWCESFAASFLMPRQEFIDLNKEIYFRNSIKRAGSIANRLFVSRKAALNSINRNRKCKLGRLCVTKFELRSETHIRTI